MAFENFAPETPAEMALWQEIKRLQRENRELRLMANEYPVKAAETPEIEVKYPATHVYHAVARCDINRLSAPGGYEIITKAVGPDTFSYAYMVTEPELHSTVSRMTWAATMHRHAIEEFARGVEQLFAASPESPN